MRMQNDSHDIHRVPTVHGPMWVFKSDIYVSRSLAVYGEYVSAETDVFRQIVRPGQTVIEAGANIGSHSVFLAKACAPGPFYAFEPQQRVFQILCANLTINGVINARAYPEGLGAQSGTVDIRIPDYADTGNFGSVSLNAPQNTTALMMPVRVSRLDDWNLAACHVIKIDVEGFEIQVLDGAQDTIRRYRPVIYVENDRRVHQAKLIEMIAGADYRLYWHVAPLFCAKNFNGVSENVFGNTASLNMLCIPRERSTPVAGMEEIDPSNWRSPFAPIG